MAVFPRRYGRSRDNEKAAVVALEAHVRYMEEQIEHYASCTAKVILEQSKKLEEQDKVIKELQERLGKEDNENG